MRSFARLMSVDPGFKPDDVMTMKVLLPDVKYDSTAVRNFVRALAQNVRALPGVQSAAVASRVPLDNSSFDLTFMIRGRPIARPSDEPAAEIRRVSSDFFKTMGIPVLQGRPIEAYDQPASQHVYVVNEAFVKKFFPNERVIGQAIHVDGQDDSTVMHEIVGVVGDVHSFGLEDAPEPTIYASVDQYPDNGLTLVARSSSPATLANPLRAVVRGLDRDVPVYSVMTMRDRVADSVGEQQFYALLIAIFASLALALAAVGLYGVIAYAVSQRTHELGVRVALGATAERITRMVITEGLTLTLAGVGIGVAVSLLIGGALASLLYGVSARDPLTLIGVAVALGVVATLASWLPARRAARVDPLVAMRGD
jgi:putative ABC transport system permease protein